MDRASHIPFRPREGEMKRVAVILLMSMANIGWQAPVHAQDSSRKDLVAVELGTDRFAAGENVTVSKPIVGDLLAAGREIVVQETVGGDVAAAGGSVRLDGAISNNTYAAGGQVFVNGTI